MMDDLERRVALLEKAVGFEVDYSVCNGNPEDCPSKACDLTRCPLMHNLIHQAYRVASDRDEDYYILKHLVETIMEVEKIPPETVTLARKKAEKDAVLRRAQQTQKMMGTIGKGALHEVFDILQQGNHTRLDELDDEIAVMEKNLNVKTHQNSP